MTDESRALATREGQAVAEPAPGSVAHTMIHGLAMQLWTSFDATTEEGKAALLRYVQGGDEESVGDSLGEVIAVRHVLVHRVEGEEVEEATGEVRYWEGDRIVLVTPDGRGIACVSKGLRKSLQLAIAVYGVPPWEPPRRFKLAQVSLKGGKRRMYQLHPVVEVTKTKK